MVTQVNCRLSHWVHHLWRVLSKRRGKKIVGNEAFVLEIGCYAMNKRLVEEEITMGTLTSVLL